jgi:murein DD-endopeptidase MepM/ murein hydrolase activator NlpD
MAQMPLEGDVRITSAYGNRTNPITGQPNEWHGGLDLVSADRTVRAAVGGRVAVSQIVTDRANATWQWGNYVAILGDDGNVIYYCHLAERRVEANQRVEAGDVIGIMGTTGYSTGIHLHFEVRDQANRQIDAAAYLGIENKIGDVKAIASDTAWSDEAVAWAVENEILYGDGNGNLMLDEPCTRRQMVVFLHRLYQRLGGR